jgi:hypothetical protein
LLSKNREEVEMRKALIFLPIAAAALLGTFGWDYIGGISSAAPRIITKTVEAVTPPPERTLVTRDVMVKALEGKLELVTASLPFDTHTIAGTCDGNWLQRLAYKNCVSLFIPGKVNAGFNWQQFGLASITTNTETITVNLGRPKIFDVVIDHEKIDVINQEDGWFVSQDNTLQTRALAKATRELKTKACHSGLLRFAAVEAEKRVGDNLRTLLHAAGDTRQVRITYMPPDCR